MLLYGIPEGVLNAKARLSARRAACLRSASTAALLVVRPEKGPLRRS